LTTEAWFQYISSAVAPPLALFLAGALKIKKNWKMENQNVVEFI